MGILEPNQIDPLDPEALARVIAEAAAAGDARCAMWLLEHHPRHRQLWGNREQIEAAAHTVLARVADGIAASGLSLEAQQRVVLAIRAAGAAARLSDSTT